MSTPKGFSLASAAETQTAEDAGILIHMRDEAGRPMFYGGTAVERDGETVIEGAKPVTWTIAGSYSSTYRKAEREFNALLSKEKRSGANVGDIIARRTIYLAAACVLSWEGMTYDGEKPLPLTRELATTVCEKAPWMLEQAVEAQNDHAGFSKPSSSP